MSVHTVNQRNVNGGFAEALWLLRTVKPEEQETRNGPALVLPHPLVTTFSHPTERVLFWDKRDANPFLHFFESLWMLAGRDDVKWPAMFAKQFLQYSDDGETLPGAYGHRWRKRFEVDQLSEIITQLRRSPDSRRAVLQMWATDPDLINAGRDVCCNLSVVFDTRGGRLNAYINNRSNDLVWGLYGANAVHFSYLLEYMAAWIGLPVGSMTTFSVNAHAYTQLKGIRDWIDAPVMDDRYQAFQLRHRVQPYSIIHLFHADGREAWDDALNLFLEDPENAKMPLNIPFFSRVAQPLFRAWKAHKDGDSDMGVLLMESVAAEDWRAAGKEWIQRRISRRKAAADAAAKAAVG